MTEGAAFKIFVTVFMGGLTLFAIAMVAVVVLLLRRNRRQSGGSAFDYAQAKKDPP